MIFLKKPNSVQREFLLRESSSENSKFSFILSKNTFPFLWTAKKPTLETMYFEWLFFQRYSVSIWYPKSVFSQPFFKEGFSSTHFGCVSYLTHPYQVLESLVKSWVRCNLIRNCWQMCSVGVPPGTALGNTALNQWFSTSWFQVWFAASSHTLW